MPGSGLLRACLVPSEQAVCDFAGQAAAEAHQSFVILFEQLPVDSRLVIEALLITKGDQLAQVAVSLFIFTQKNEVVIRRPAVLSVLNEARTRCDIDFAADDGFQSAGLHLGIEFYCGEQIAVVGNGHRGHFVFLGLCNEVRYANGPIEQ